MHINSGLYAHIGLVLPPPYRLEQVEETKVVEYTVSAPVSGSLPGFDFELISRKVQSLMMVSV